MEIGSLPFDDFGIALIVVVILVATIVVVGPYALLAVVFLLETALWAAVGAAGITAAFVLRRPWTVAVIDQNGNVTATATVRGRRAANRHADVVRTRLRDNFDPVAAVRHYN